MKLENVHCDRVGGGGGMGRNHLPGAFSGNFILEKSMNKVENLGLYSLKTIHQLLRMSLGPLVGMWTTF